MVNKILSHILFHDIMSKLGAHNLEMRNLSPRERRLTNIFVLGTDLLTTEGKMYQI